MPVPDLITGQYASAFLNLSAADAASRLPGAIAAASRLVRQHCGRTFTRRPSADGTLGPIDELITPPLRGQLVLAEYPINDVLRVSTSKTTVFVATNDDAATNQRATCRLVRTGDAVAGYATTGLYLERWASGVKASQTITFASLATPTLGALATAVNAVGGGWRAYATGAAGDATDYSKWPVSELRAGQGALGALQDEAEFEAWVDDAAHERDDAAGTITLVRGDNDPFTSLRWGPTAGLEFGDDQVRGGLDAVRVVYDAGYDTIPEDLQQATVEIVKAILERKATSTTVQRERTDTWEIWTREVIHAIPAAAREVLGYYRDHAR